jgi:hypothetical protein
MYGHFPNHPEYEMTRGGTPAPVDAAKRAARAAWLAAFAMAAVLGCMAADPAGPESNQTSTVPDPNQLAGATSSTNWPQEDVGSKIVIAKVELDSQFRIKFLDTTGKSLAITGTVTAFAGKDIPVFRAPDSSKIPFTDAASISVSPSDLPGIGEMDGDSLVFTLRIQTDSQECLMTRFLYSKGQRKFIDFGSPNFSRTFRMSVRKYGLRVVPDDSLPLTHLPNSERRAWCIYIPASPYYFLLDSAGIVEIGPLPDGGYPLRLLKIGEPEGKEGTRRVTVYEVRSGISRKNPNWNTSLELGQKIDEFVTKSSISIRS